MSLILLGTRRTRAAIALTNETLCPRCHNRARYAYVRTRLWFTVWFIPILLLSTKHALICPVCSHAIALTVGEARHARRGELRLSSDDDGTSFEAV